MMQYQTLTSVLVIVLFINVFILVQNLLERIFLVYSC